MTDTTTITPQPPVESIDLAALTKPLGVEDLDFRIQSINKGGYATILVYKDARTDMKRLDEVVGPLNWKREHLKDNANCVVSIWDAGKEQWVSKEDTGTESATESEKGLASDSFKRACFNWGIGRELYDYPVIQVKLNDDEFEEQNGRMRQTWKLRLREWKWNVEFEGRAVVGLTGHDQNGKKRFGFSASKPASAPPKTEAKPAPKKEPEAKPKMDVTDFASKKQVDKLGALKAELKYDDKKVVEAVKWASREREHPVTNAADLTSAEISAVIGIFESRAAKKRALAEVKGGLC